MSFQSETSIELYFSGVPVKRKVKSPTSLDGENQDEMSNESGEEGQSDEEEEEEGEQSDEEEEEEEGGNDIEEGDVQILM